MPSELALNSEDKNSKLFVERVTGIPLLRTRLLRCMTTAISGHHPATVSHQRLDGRDRTGREVDDGLVVQHELAPLDRVMHPGDQLKPSGVPGRLRAWRCPWSATLVVR